MRKGNYMTDVAPHEASARGVLWGVPRTNNLLVQRPTFYNAIDQALASERIVRVEAPSGYGKSVAVALWARQPGRAGNALWIEINEWIPTWQDLWVALVDSLIASGLAPSRGIEWGISAVSPDLASLRRFLQSSLAALAEPLTLVFDGVDRLSGEPQENLLHSLVDPLDGVSAVLISNETRERFLWQQPAVLTAEELRVTVDEVISVGELHGTTLTEEFARSIIAESGGRIDVIRAYAAYGEIGGEHPSSDGLRSAGLLFAAMLRERMKKIDVGCGEKVALLIAAFRELDYSLMARMLPEIPDLLSLLNRLIQAGVVIEREEGRSSQYSVPLLVAEPLLADAYTFFGVELDDLRRVASEEYRARGHYARSVEQYLLRDDRDGAIAMLGGEWQNAFLRSGVSEIRNAFQLLPGDALSGNYEMIAIRMAVAMVQPREQAVIDLYRSRLQSLPARTIEGLPPLARILINASRSELALLDHSNEYTYRYAEDMLSEVYSLLATEPELIDPLLPTAYNIAGNAAIASGNTQEALARFTAGADLAEARGQIWESAWGSSGKAFALAAIGEHERALVTANQAIIMADSHGWGAAPYLVLAHYAKVLAYGSRNDLNGLAQVVLQYDPEVQPDNPWSHFTILMSAVMCAYRGEYSEALTLARGLLDKPRGGIFPMTRWVATYLCCDVYLAMGRTVDGLDLVRETHNVDDSHSFCVYGLRARCYVVLGEPDSALNETAGCVQLGNLHAPRSLADVLFARACAFYLKGNHAAADRAYLDAVRLCRGAGSLGSLRMLPQDIANTLYERAAQTEPALLEQVFARASDIEGVTGSATKVLLALSNRERKVLEMLGSSLTVPQIAADLYVSVNTVKTQARVLYRKLGVHTRAEAVEFLHELGLRDSLG